MGQELARGICEEPWKTLLVGRGTLPWFLLCSYHLLVHLLGPPQKDLGPDSGGTKKSAVATQCSSLARKGEEEHLLTILRASLCDWLTGFSANVPVVTHRSTTCAECQSKGAQAIKPALPNSELSVQNRPDLGMQFLQFSETTPR